ncbi:MAG: hypothetical protein ACP5VE_11825 [Chthonomonadales bacterium]
MGTTPLPSASRDMADALRVAASACELMMHWPGNTGTGFLAELERPVAKGLTYVEAVRRMGLEPVVNVNPWTVLPGKGIVRNDGSGCCDFGDASFRRQMVRDVAAAARRFRPAYFSIGNEVNTVAQLSGARAFHDLLLLEGALYRAIKQASPQTKVVMVVSWSQLADGDAPPDYSLLRRVASVCDVVGFTSYPWHRHSTPDTLPQDYYRRIARYVRKPIGFTEIGWTSDPALGGREDVQARFLVRFLELTRGMHLEFVNWAFLHDLPSTAVHGVAVQRTHLGLGLRRLDGTPKPVWFLWAKLHSLPIVPRR